MNEYVSALTINLQYFPIPLYVKIFIMIAIKEIKNMQNIFKFICKPRDE